MALRHSRDGVREAGQGQTLAMRTNDARSLSTKAVAMVRPTNMRRRRPLSTSFAKRASVWFASTAALGWTTRQLDPDERRQERAEADAESRLTRSGRNLGRAVVLFFSL